MKKGFLNFTNAACALLVGGSFYKLATMGSDLPAPDTSAKVQIVDPSSLTAAIENGNGAVCEAKPFWGEAVPYTVGELNKLGDEILVNLKKGMHCFYTPTERNYKVRITAFNRYERN